MDRIELKKSAKACMKENKSVIIKVVLIWIAAGIILGLAQNYIVYNTTGLLYTILDATTAVLLIILELGITNVFINIARGKNTTMVDFYKPFSDNILNKSLTIMLSGIYLIFWTILFIIPGIIKSYSYAMVPYILADEEEDLLFNEAITKSRQMMDGHKLEYFVLTLSFIPWFILTGLTLGIAAVYTVPYVQTTTAKFYLELKNKEKNKIMKEKVDSAIEAEVL